MHDAHNLGEYQGCDTKNLPPLSHRDDPQTSYVAADNMIKSGALSSQEEDVLGEINIHVGKDKDFTAKELAWESQDKFYGSGISYYTIQRRLSGIHRKGLIERTGEKRDGCCVWCLI